MQYINAWCSIGAIKSHSDHEPFRFCSFQSMFNTPNISDLKAFFYLFLTGTIRCDVLNVQLIICSTGCAGGLRWMEPSYDPAEPASNRD